MLPFHVTVGEHLQPVLGPHPGTQWWQTVY